MAGTYDQLVQFQDYMREMYMQADLEFRQAINAETGGTITMVTRPTPGNFFPKTTYGREDDLVRNEAPNVRGSATEKQLKQIQQVDIKTGVTSDKIYVQDIANRWSGRSADEQLVLGAQEIIRQMMKNKVTVAYACLVAFLSRGLLTSGKDTEIEKVILDKTTGNTAVAAQQMDLGKLLEAKSVFNDRRDDITGIVMHGACFGKMQARNLASYSDLFSGRFGSNFAVTDSEGTPIYRTDNPALTFTEGNVTKYRTLLLTRDAVTVYNSGQFSSNIEGSNENTWIEHSYKAEDIYNIGIKAGTWASTTAVHPKLGTTAGTGKLAGLHTDAGVLDNPASWARLGVAESKPVTFKHLPGVMLITQ